MTSLRSRKYYSFLFSILTLALLSGSPASPAAADTLETKSTITFTAGDPLPTAPVIRQEKPTVVTAPNLPSSQSDKRLSSGNTLAATGGKTLYTAKGNLPQTNEDRQPTLSLTILGMLMVGLFGILLIGKRSEDDASAELK